MSEILNIIQQVGFPIFVSIFFLLKLDKNERLNGEYIKTLTAIQAAIENQTNRISELCEKVIR